MQHEPAGQSVVTLQRAAHVPPFMVTQPAPTVTPGPLWQQSDAVVQVAPGGEPEVQAVLPLPTPELEPLPPPDPEPLPPPDPELPPPVTHMPLEHVRPPLHVPLG
jgi:hypothetical protein